MKKIILVLSVSLIGFVVAQAQLLWKITGNGLKQPSYIFGTQDLISIQFLDSVSGLFKAFNECDIVVGETVLNRIDETARIQQAAIMPSHINIKDLLSDEEYKMIDNELKSVMKFGLKEVSIMNPTLILSLYKTEIFKQQTGFKDGTQSDSYFQLVASEKDKKIVGLENVEQQIKSLYGFGTLERQADLLVEAIQHKDKVINEMIQLNKLYKAGKIDELIKYSTAMTQEEYAKVIDNRNADWLTKIPELLKKSSCFVCVGAIHLGGNNGLIKQLERKGYKVKAVE